MCLVKRLAWGRKRKMGQWWKEAHTDGGTLYS